MDVDVISVPADAGGRLSAGGLSRALEATDCDGLFAVVATAGTTNFGSIDDLAGLAGVAHERGVWFHVDAAYGGAGLAAPSVCGKFRGIEQADSFVVDPHKWLFAPYDCCALVYRDPEAARRAHTQAAGFLEPLRTLGEWNPMDYAVHLTRRARGLPFWFSLIAHGTRAYTEAIERTLAVAQAAAQEVRRRAYLQLLREPDLSVVVFRRLGWTPQDYSAWSDRLMKARFAFITPTTHDGDTVARLAIVNPRTTEADIVAILDTMA
jgi:glutamate/tyrosine decarboxylase-like PLP-dependent enzyme